MKVVLTKKEHVEQAARILFDAYFESLEEEKDYVEKKIKSKESYVAVLDGKVAGFISYRGDYSHYANYMGNLVVADESRRKGVATKLLEKFVEVSKKEQPAKQKYALSSTDVSNTASIKLHEKFGFEKLGVVKELHFGKDEIFFGYDVSKKK